MDEWREAMVTALAAVALTFWSGYAFQLAGRIVWEAHALSSSAQAEREAEFLARHVRAWDDVQ